MNNEKIIRTLRKEIDYLERLQEHGRIIECIPSGESSGIPIADLIDALNESVRVLDGLDKDY